MNKELLTDGFLGVSSVVLIKSGVDNISFGLQLLSNAENYRRQNCTDTIKAGTNQLIDQKTGVIVNIDLSESRAEEMRQQCIDVHIQNLKPTDVGEFTTGVAMTLGGILAISLIVLRNKNYFSRLIRAVATLPPLGG